MLTKTRAAKLYHFLKRFVLPVHKLISITRAVSFVENSSVLKGPKSKAGIRKVPMVPQLRDILFAARKDSGYIVSKDGISPYSDTMYIRTWKIN